MNAEIKEYFHLLKEVCRAEYPSLGIAYRQLRGLLEHLCRTQMTDSNLQMTDLSAPYQFCIFQTRTDCYGAKPPAYFPAYF